MDTLLTWAGLAALGVQVTSIVTFLSAGQVDRAVKALLPWLGLFLVLLLAAQADATADLMVPELDVALGALDVASLVLVAATVGSSGSVAFVNFRKAFDHADSAAEPRLPIGDPPTPAV